MRYPSLYLCFILLSACNQLSARPPAPSEPPQRAQVENWRGGSATLQAHLRGEGGAAEVAAGTLSAAGELEFVLKHAAAAQLTGFTACPNVTVSDPALRLGSFSALLVVDDNAVHGGRIALVSGPSVVGDGLRQVGDYYLQFTYADRAARIEGSCAVGGAPGTLSYALELERGWNPVVFKLAGEEALHLSTGPVPADAAWFFSEVAP